MEYKETEEHKANNEKTYKKDIRRIYRKKRIAGKTKG